MKSKLTNTKGSALLITLALLIMVAGLAIVSLNRATTDVDLSYNQVHEEQAFYIAEAGAERAFVELNSDKTWRTGYADITFGDGSYTVVLIDSLADSTLMDTIIIRSTGSAQQGRATVDLEVNFPPHHPFKYAMFGDSWINLAKQTCTDSYNSDSGAYATTVLDTLGDVGSNGTVATSKDVTFGGGIQVATPGGISLGPFNTLNGDTSSTSDSVMMAAVPQAEYDYAEANNHALAGLSGTNFTYDVVTDTLSVGAFGNVVMDEGLYHFSAIILGQGATITVQPNESVDLYVTGDITLNQSSTVNVGGKPTDFMIWSQGSQLLFCQDNTFYGTFYGPNAHIQYDQTTQVYGALVGSSIQLDQLACFHYDRSLGDFTKGTENELNRIAWGEIY